MLIGFGMNLRGWLYATSAFHTPYLLGQVAYSDAELARIIAKQEETKGRIDRWMKS